MGGREEVRVVLGIAMGQKSVFVTSLGPVMKSRRNKGEPILIVRGSIKGLRDPAVIITVVSDGIRGDGLPARMVVGGNILPLSSIMCTRRVEAVSGAQLLQCINTLPGRSVTGISGTLGVDVKMG